MKFILLNINRNRKIVDFLGGKIVDKIVGKKRNWFKKVEFVMSYKWKTLQTTESFSWQNPTPGIGKD